MKLTNPVDCGSAVENWLKRIHALLEQEEQRKAFHIWKCGEAVVIRLCEMDKENARTEIPMRLVLWAKAQFDICHLLLAILKLTNEYSDNIVAHQDVKWVIQTYNSRSIMRKGVMGLFWAELKGFATTDPHFFLSSSFYMNRPALLSYLVASWSGFWKPSMNTDIIPDSMEIFPMLYSIPKYFLWVTVREKYCISLF